MICVAWQRAVGTAGPSEARMARQILPWAGGATVDVELNEDIRARAREFEAVGVKPMDSLHLACAEAAGCDWFFTTDTGILRTAKSIASVRVANPIEFVGGV